MKFLGISGSYTVGINHDCSVALVIDGKLVENCEEERFSRVKHSFNQFPNSCIKDVLRRNGLKLRDIDAIGVPHDISNIEATVNGLKNVDDTFDLNRTKLFYKTHHLNHVLDSYYQSGFNHALALIVDGNGDERDGLSVYTVNGDEIKCIKKYALNQSLGTFYGAGADYAGFKMFEEGKFMGLASFGNPYEIDNILFNDGEIITKHMIEVNTSEMISRIHLSYFKRQCYPYNILDLKDKSNTVMYYANFAASIQNKYNEILLDLATYYKKLTGEDNLILSGGCIQNCIGNEIIIKSGLFKNVFAAPAPHDAGCAAGLAFLAAREMGEKIENKRLTNSYTGRNYSDEEILNTCKKYSLEVKPYDQHEFVKLLSNNVIVGWFQGGSELGPRALGHRSIIANPANRKNLTIINGEIKHREVWRPLAPSVPAELFDKIFDTPSHDLCEFMLRTIEIRPEMRKKMIAVCHIDNTTRPQYLEREINPEYYDMIMEFYKKTGCPGVINTSFNDRGEPIVETPEEAIKDFLKWDNMGILVFNAKYMIKKI